MGAASTATNWITGGAVRGMRKPPRGRPAEFGPQSHRNRAGPMPLRGRATRGRKQLAIGTLCDKIARPPGIRSDWRRMRHPSEGQLGGNQAGEIDGCMPLGTLAACVAIVKATQNAINDISVS
eukprot:10295422-Alexandrium_andersonii.AAC.1